MNSEQMLNKINEQGIRIGELGSALTDTLDGIWSWWDLQDVTGLDEKRCKEILVIRDGEYD